jgi:2-desacetyl-2-hydroxyethyl bacteriochlorophyllide A dehydrogenase
MQMMIFFLKGIRKIEFPHLSGHEACGEVVDVGSNVNGISIGDRVAIDPNIHCGKCSYCNRGKFNLCKNKKVLGISLPGCFAEYVKIVNRNAWKLPASIANWQGALIEPVAVALHVFNKSEVKIGENIALFGAGSIGLILVQLFKKSGADVTVIDKIKYKLERARELGADRVINVSERSFQSVIDEANYYHKIIDAAGVPVTIEESIQLAGPGSSVIWLGLPTTDVKINAFNFLYQELSLYASLAYNYEFEEAINFIDKGIIDLEKIVTHRYSFTDMEKAFSILEKGDAIKSIILMQ